MSITAEEKARVISDFGKHERDTGSSEVQIALLTDQIKRLTEHMKQHRKDFRTQRSLIIMVSRRQKHLRYLKQADPEKYRDVIARLGLRK
ncbi:MAG TPA: 30S ribosomal protein S15 [bacterium]|nr:30S ribosomal protein S15 [bacterium]HPJ71366.1 30S ribosomal protein S15 [bacterium]HPQ67145.1 30S ribosomal protein S15 [bacterium]